jgi:hypothetical protein
VFPLFTASIRTSNSFPQEHLNIAFLLLRTLLLFSVLSENSGSTSFINISAGANTSNADLILVGSNNYPNALKIDYKGVALFNVTGTSGSLFKIKNQGIDLFAVRYDGVAFAREVVVTLSSFPDYVFANDYKLISLKEVKKYINLNNKLPHMPSAKEVNENGASLGEIQKITVEKVEELFLYVIQLEEKIEILNNKLKDFENAK